MALAKASAGDIFSPSDILSTLMGVGQLAPASSMARFMHMDVAETDSAFEIKADVPGVSKDDVHIDVEGDTVRLGVEQSAARDEDEDVAGTTIHRHERAAAFASRSLRFPPSANLDAMTARLQNGVLHVSVPKKDEAGGKKRVAVE